MQEIANMIGKEVVVVANDVEYRGVLIEISEDSIFLKAPSQWIEIPTAGVSSVRPAWMVEEPKQEASDRGSKEPGIDG